MPGTSSFLRYQYPSSLPSDVRERLTDISRRVVEAIDLIADGKFAGPREIAEKLVRTSERLGGAFVMDDLASHRAEWVEPVTVDDHGVIIDDDHARHTGTFTTIRVPFLLLVNRNVPPAACARSLLVVRSWRHDRLQEGVSLSR